MSIEYYTVPPIPFEQAKAELEADNEGWIITPRPDSPRFYPECQAHYISKGDGGIWLLNTHPDWERTIEGVVVAPAGSVWFESFGHSYRLIPELMSWIERVLDVRVLNEVGLEWEHDAGLEPKERCGGGSGNGDLV